MGIRIYYKQELRGVQSSIDQSDTVKSGLKIEDGHTGNVQSNKIPRVPLREDQKPNKAIRSVFLRRPGYT